jgi:hypothetical protein
MRSELTTSGMIVEAGELDHGLAPDVEQLDKPTTQ